MTTKRPNRNAILFLGPDEIKGLISMEEAVAAIEQGYREADEFPIGNAPRRRVHSPQGVQLPRRYSGARRDRVFDPGRNGQPGG